MLAATPKVSETPSGAAMPATVRGGRTATPSFTPVRPPAVPLAVRSPYLSAWLDNDNLPGTWPTFWTGRVNAMSGIARIDGTS